MPIRIAPDSSPLQPGPLVFLAGSIEQGKATHWQAAVTQRLLAVRPDLVIANPRRASWDASWSQDDDNPELVHQINWELDHLLAGGHALFVFDPATQSPITLLELGLLLATAPHRVTVVCPKGFWRRGNVVVTARRFGVQVLETIDQGIEHLLTSLPQP